jgi:hypothetical protein
MCQRACALNKIQLMTSIKLVCVLALDFSFQGVFSNKGIQVQPTVGLVFLCSKTFPEVCTLVPKHVEFNTCHELHFIKGICWLMF